MGPLAKPPLARPCRRAVLIALGVALLSVLLAACESGSGHSPAATASPSATAFAAPTGTPTPTPSPALGEPVFQSQRAMEHVRALSVEIGSRPAGTDAESRAAEYIRDELRGLGYRAFLQPFAFQQFVDLRTTLEVLSPQPRTIEAKALQRSPSGSAEGELAAAGLGRPEEFPAGTQGKIALIERGELYLQDKVRNAAQAGAAAAIIYNSDPGIFQGAMAEQSAIPAVAISREDGQALLQTLAAGPVRVRLAVETETRTAESRNVIGKPPGGRCTVIAGGHYDSVPQGPGANDNASGTSTVLEMARVLAADGEFDDVCYVLFGAEEIGLVGSSHYVQSLAGEERTAVRYMLNFDMLAVGDGWPFVGSPELVELAGQQAQQLGVAYNTSGDLPPNVGSDHSPFINAGIPAVLFNCFCDPHYHGPDDRIDFLRPERLEQAGNIALGMVQALLGE